MQPLLADRLKTIEHLLLKCVVDLPAKGSHFQDGTRDGYDGCEMLDFLDESLTNIIHEYEEQVAKYDLLLRSSDRTHESPLDTIGLSPARPCDYTQKAA